MTGTETIFIETFEVRSREKIATQKRNKNLCWSKQDAERMVRLMT